MVPCLHPVSNPDQFLCLSCQPLRRRRRGFRSQYLRQVQAFPAIVVCDPAHPLPIYLNSLQALLGRRGALQVQPPHLHPASLLGLSLRLGCQPLGEGIAWGPPPWDRSSSHWLVCQRAAEADLNRKDIVPAEPVPRKQGLRRGLGLGRS